MRAVEVPRAHADHRLPAAVMLFSSSDTHRRPAKRLCEVSLFLRLPISGRSTRDQSWSRERDRGMGEGRAALRSTALSRPSGDGRYAGLGGQSEPWLPDAAGRGVGPGKDSGGGRRARRRSRLLLTFKTRTSCCFDGELVMGAGVATDVMAWQCPSVSEGRTAPS